MSYFNYHAAAKKMIKDGKLISWYYTERHNAVSPALVLLFDDVKHPVMPIRKEGIMLANENDLYYNCYLNNI